jgi:voltage-gated potassium channel
MDREIRKALQPLLFLVFLLILSSMVLYFLAHRQHRDVSLLTCIYMVMITVSTVGYEDVLNSKESTSLMVFNIITILIYLVVVAYTVSNLTAFLVEGRLRKYFEYIKLRKRIRKMDQHYIICGVKDLGFFVALELHQTQRPFVVIDDSLRAIEALREEVPSLVYIEGDATDDHILVNAGVERAKALVACLDTDKENLYLVVTAKEWNKNLQLAAKYTTPKARRRLANVGASCLVSPHMIGGLRIASELIRPQVVSFLDQMLRNTEKNSVRVEELTIPENSPFVGKTLQDIYREHGIVVISYHDARTNDFEYNPHNQRTIRPGMTIIFIATPEERASLERSLGGQ